MSSADEEIRNGSASAVPRRSRQQRSRETETLLLETAVKALADYGYAGATTTRIQELADVTRGRLLHHFPSRDHLLVAAVQHLSELKMKARTPPETLPKDASERIDHAVEQMWVTYRLPIFWASVELWLASRHHHDLREALLPAERMVGTLIHESVDALFGPVLSSHPGYVDLRELLNTSMRGVALTYTFHPRDPDVEPHLRLWKNLARQALGH